ncbi:MAG: MoaD/ThiS family protein [Planctomycetes bacterium]|nr:MoaD/ThiS family protein [Planctomycetota bacterium]
MITQVILPGPLRRFADGENTVAVEAETVGEALGELVKKYEEIGERLYDENGEIRKAFNIFLNDESVGSLAGLNTCIKEGDEVSVLVALAGG